jgi:hypothetical protein
MKAAERKSLILFQEDSCDQERKPVDAAEWQEHSDADFSHGICDECIDKLYPELSVSRSSPRDE